MELISRTRKAALRNQQGMSLIELMIAMVVLAVGVIGSASLLAVAMGGNDRSRQQSNATVIAQMVTEKISSVKATTSPDLTVTDCAGNSLTISTAGPAGETVTSAGAIDYTAAIVTNYQMNYVDCGNGGQQKTYDVRWNIQQPTGYVKLLTVSAKLRGSATDPKFFSLPVTVRTLVGQGT